MALYYLPLLIRSDRYYIAKLDSDSLPGNREETDFNFVIPADERVMIPIVTLEDPARVVMNQMAPSDRQDIPLQECRFSLRRTGNDVELLIEKTGSFGVDSSYDDELGIRLDYTEAARRIQLSYYHQRVEARSMRVFVTFRYSETESYSCCFAVAITRSRESHRVVIDFGSEASQVGYKHCGPQAAVMQYDILDNIISRMMLLDKSRTWRREDFLNNEPGTPLLFRSFYAVKKQMNEKEREAFPFNFTNDWRADEIRLFIARQEVAATNATFREQYEIIPNLKLGIEKSLQLVVGNSTEDYSIRTHKKDLISAILLRLLRLMISTKPDFQRGGLIVTLLVPNIYTQHDVFDLLQACRAHTKAMLLSLGIADDRLQVEFETISESDAAFMGFQQTHPDAVQLANGEMALVMDCGKGTTDISMVMADDNENYSSFFRTGFAGAGNVISYSLVEDFLTLVLRAIPGNNQLSVKEFINRHIQQQNLTVDVLNFLQWIEEVKKRYAQLPAIGLSHFAQLAEESASTERTVATLYRDPSTLLPYAEAILRGRNLRWDDEITGLADKAVDCLVQAMVSSIGDVMTRDVKKRIKLVMLSGRAFYFDTLRVRVETALRQLLGDQVQIRSLTRGHAINNKNVAIHGAFTGAYKITDFTGIPVDKKEGLSRNNDVLNNNMFLYRGIKIQPGNDILYNTSVVRRNNQQLKAFRNKTIDIYFTRDNIYLRLLENQQVKDVRSLYSIMTGLAEVSSPILELKAISVFPASTGELASVAQIYRELQSQPVNQSAPVKKGRGILQFFQF